MDRVRVDEGNLEPEQAFARRVVDQVGAGSSELGERRRQVAHLEGDVVHAGTAFDFSERMLERARRKAPELEWLVGDLLALPFADASFDAATVGFGVRNVEDVGLALRELRRVLRAGGRLGILEITRPRGLLAPFYRFWFDAVVPLLGKLLPGGAAYSYLPASVRRFPGPEELVELIRAAGFADVRHRTFAGGIVALHTAVAG